MNSYGLGCVMPESVASDLCENVCSLATRGLWGFGQLHPLCFCFCLHVDAREPHGEPGTTYCSFPTATKHKSLRANSTSLCSRGIANPMYSTIGLCCTPCYVNHHTSHCITFVCITIVSLQSNARCITNLLHDFDVKINQCMTLRFIICICK